MLGRVYTPYFNDIQTILAAYIQVYDGFSYQTGVIDSLKRNRLLESPYSCTSWSNDLPDNVPSFFLPFLERNHLVRGIKTKVPTITHTMPTGKKEKKDSGSKPAPVNVF